MCVCVCVCACVKVERSGLETDLEMLLGRERSELQVGGVKGRRRRGSSGGGWGVQPCSQDSLSVTLGKLHAV